MEEGGGAPFFEAEMRGWLCGWLGWLGNAERGTSSMVIRSVITYWVYDQCARKRKAHYCLKPSE